MLEQSRADDEHLQLLAIFHFVCAGLSVLGLGFLGLHYTFLHAIMGAPELARQTHGGPAFPDVFAIFRWFYAAMGALLLFAAAGNLLSGFFLREKRHRTFSLVVSALNCLQVPFGTVLGIFTILVLLRPSVEAAYRAREVPSPL